MKRLLLQFLCFPVVLVMMSSCAILYTGEDIPETLKDALPVSDCSATFRFLDVSDLQSLHSYNAKYRVSNVLDSQYYLTYLKSLNVFTDVRIIDFSIPAIEFTDEKQLADFLEKNRPEVETDIFVDVHMETPMTYHGTGLGMWGGFFSAITLGILPAWWTHETQFQVLIDKDGKRLNESKFINDYNSFSSTLFYLVPSSETMLGIGNRISIPHMNELNFIVKNVVEKGCRS